LLTSGASVDPLQREYGSVEPLFKRRKITIFRPLPIDRGGDARRSSSSCLRGSLVRVIQQQQYLMTEQVSPLRQRMIDDMAIRNMSPNTQKAYIRAVKNFSKHFGRRLDFDQPTGTLMSPTPSTWPCITSPCFTAPTPAGVPLMMRSPGASSNRAERCWITSGTFQIS